MTEPVSTPKDGIAKTPEEAARLALLEADYRAGLKPLRQLGAEHGVSHTQVTKLAAKLGWVRDLDAKIRAQADAKVSKAAVSSGVDVATRRVAEAVVVEANANLQYQVRIRHRAQIQRLSGVFDQLAQVQEVYALSYRAELLQLAAQLHEIPAGAEQDERREGIRKRLLVIANGSGGSEALKELSVVLERLIKLERQAYGIEAGAPEDSPASAVGAAAEAAAGAGRGLSAVERAIRLHRLLADNPGALAALLPAAGQRPAA